MNKVFAGVFIYLISCGLYSAPHNGCVKLATVTEVGGCDRDGKCGVKLDDGQFDELLKPVRGQTICRAYKTDEVKWKWLGFE